MAGQHEPGRDVSLRGLPVEQIVADDALTLKRGCTTVRIDGEHAPEIVGAVLELAGAADRTEDELVACFAPEARESIRSLIGELRARRLLLPADAVEDTTAESPLDVFYWHFGLPDERSPAPPQDKFVAVVGRSRTATRLGALLDEAGFGEIAVVADPDLGDDVADEPLVEREPAAEALGDRLQAATGRFPSIVAAVSERGFGPLRAWNELALAREVPFLPVVIEDLVAYVGPLVVPHETACFECLLRRRYSNLDEAKAREAVELRRGGARIVGLHPAISAVAAGAAALELSKFFIPWRSAQQAGYLLTFNLLAGRAGRHRVLKVPRCAACSSLKTRQPATAVRAELTSDAV
ncbi:MAG TPA: TOMM precursor leader peptide-binding protein [Gaiellaceae bacterium]|jgi:bacteriocin biosynthesis cyclodehydratase domain-containing protein